LELRIVFFSQGPKLLYIYMLIYAYYLSVYIYVIDHIYIYCIYIYCIYIYTYSRPDTGSPEVGGLDLQSDQREHSGGSLDVLVVSDKSLL
jgi:hypothetical protein